MFGVIWWVRCPALCAVVATLYSPVVSTQRLEIAGLTTHIVDRADAAVTAILLHGFGAPGDDLVALAHVIDAPARFVFPAAPIQLGGMYGDGRAWWPLDLAKLEAELRGGRNEAMRREVPPGLPQARAQILELVEAVAQRYSLTTDRIILGGFSQGSMLAIDVALHAASAPAGLVVLSGAVVAWAEWLPLMSALASMAIFQSHGRQDPLLPFSGAEWLGDQMRQVGANVEWHPFDGGHTIPVAVLSALGGFVRKCASTP